MKENKIPYKTYLDESEIPTQWYNVRADMKNKPAPLLNPGTHKPMTAEEAILQMNLLGHAFFAFVDQESGATCVVYKRKEGSYGMLVPEK